MYKEKVDREFDASEAWGRNIEPFERNPLENDGYIVLVVILGALVACISLYGADAFIEDVASVIYKMLY